MGADYPEEREEGGNSGCNWTEIYMEIRLSSEKYKKKKKTAVGIALLQVAHIECRTIWLSSLSGRKCFLAMLWNGFENLFSIFKSVYWVFVSLKTIFI